MKTGQKLVSLLSFVGSINNNSYKKKFLLIERNTNMNYS